MDPLDGVGRDRQREADGRPGSDGALRGIIQAHGGKISAESKVGAGTTIRFTLPIAANAV